MIVARFGCVASEIHRREPTNVFIVCDGWRPVLGLTCVWFIVSTALPEQHGVIRLLVLERLVLSIMLSTSASWDRYTSMWSSSSVRQLYFMPRTCEI